MKKDSTVKILVCGRVISGKHTLANALADFLASNGFHVKLQDREVKSQRNTVDISQIGPEHSGVEITVLTQE